MHTLDNMKQAIAYIEEHLDKELSLEEAARTAACSPYHFQRMFTFLTGIPLSEYIRRRRLTMAAFDLKNSREKIVDIALKYGYSSPDGFSRAFQQLHGISPSEARKKEVRLKAYPPVSFTLSLKGVTEMNYTITEKPEMIIAGVKKRLPQMELGQSVGEMWSSTSPKTFSAISTLPGGDKKPLLGVYAEMYEDNTTDYYIGGFTTSKDASGGLPEILVIPPAAWAVFEIKGPLPTAMAEVWGRIFSEWFPASGFEHAELPEIEWYSPGDMSSEEYESEIWIPVVKAVR